MIFTEITEKEFLAFREQYKEKNFWQSVEMNHFSKLRNSAWQYVYVGLKNNNEIIACASLQYQSIFGPYRYYRSLRGFLIDYEDIAVLDTFLKELNIYLKNNHCLYLFSDPYFEYQKHDVDGKPYGDKADAVLKTFIENGWRHHGFGSGESNDYEPRWMSIINMNSRTKEEIFNSFSSRTRYDIRHTEKMRIQVRQLELNELHILKEFIDLSGQEKGYQTRNLSYYENFQKAFGDQMIALYAYLEIEQCKQKYQDEINSAKEKLERISSQQKGRKKIAGSRI